MPATRTVDQPGGVLVVLSTPDAESDRLGMPLQGESARLAKALLKVNYNGPVTFDHAVRCAGGKDVKTVHIEACQGYLEHSIRTAQPSRIICMGKEAAYAVTGHELHPLSSRKAYAWRNGVPVFFLLHPWAAQRNRFVKRWLMEDLVWALNAQITPDLALTKGVAYVLGPDDAWAADALEKPGSRLSFDCEYRGRPHDASFQLLSAAVTEQDSIDSWVWSVDAGSLELSSPACQGLARLVQDARIHKVGVNVKVDMHALHHHLGVEVAGVVMDCRDVSRALDTEADADLGTQQLRVGMGGSKDDMANLVAEEVAKARYNESVEAEPFYAPRSKAEKLAGVGKPKECRIHGRHDTVAIDNLAKRDGEPLRWAFALVNADSRDAYNGRDTLTTDRIASQLEQRLEQSPRIKRVHDLIMRPAIEAVAEMEWNGIGVSVDAIHALANWCAIRQQELTPLLSTRLQDPGNDGQVAELLYNQMGLRVVDQWGRKTIPKTDKGAPSVDKDALKSLAEASADPFLHALVKWRRYRKIRSTYADGDGKKPGGLLVHVRDDGRIHSSFNISGTRTGRMSSTDPNIANITRDEGEEGKLCRDIFVSRPGYSIVQADYSQLEIRIAAMLSQDPAWIAMLASGEDFHLATAREIAPIVWNLAAEAVGKPQRTGAKAFNFGLMYGMTDAGIAQRAKCTPEMAAKIRAAVLGKAKKLARWIEECLSYARINGCTHTFWQGTDPDLDTPELTLAAYQARTRNLYQIADDSGKAKSTAENSAYNTPVQGTASDYCLASVVELRQWIKKERVPAYLINSVYDSIMLEVRNDCIADVAQKMREVMTGWPSVGVPLVADLEVGESWGNMQKLAV